MRSVLQDLQELVDENKKLLAATELDMEWLQRWSRQRERIFARFKSADFSLPYSDGTTAANLIKEILEADAIIIARFKRELVILEQKITATQNIGRLLKTNAGSNSPALLRRVA